MTGIFDGQSVYIIGGGPSIRDVDMESLRGKSCIAVNTSFYIAPFAQVMFFADEIFYRQHDTRFHKFKGEAIYYTDDEQKITPHDPRMIRLKTSPKDFVKRGKELKEIGKCGNAGLRAINLAYLLGAEEVILLGFDANPDGVRNWHSDGPFAHKRSTNGVAMSNGAIAAADIISCEIQKVTKKNSYVKNATKGSFITAFQMLVSK